ncbi:hypothetical protein G6F43_009215 [Rhizopus delemar]|nr:hypothetical protein G6F43_009215 [Rhizopus delemar]
MISLPKLEELHGTSEWVIDNVNILSTFYEYSRSNRLQQTEMRFLVKKDAEKILSLSGIFVLKKHNKTSSTVESVFSASVQEKMYKQVMKRLYHGDCSYVAGTIDNDEARYKLFSLLRKYAGSNRVVLRCAQAVLPGTFKSAVSAISEAELLASYVHPFMQALFSGWEPQKVPHASDKVFSDEKITNNARPDYIVDVYKQADVRYANVIGELKVKGPSKRDIAKDFCRVALLTKEVMDKNKLNAAMGFQAIGIHVYRTM